MKQKRMKMGALLLLGLGLTAVQAQTTMIVKTKSGTNNASVINDTRKLTFSGGNLVVTKKDASVSSFAISDTRYLNFSQGVTTDLSNAKQSVSKLTVYPNPAQDRLTVSIAAGTSERVQLDVFGIDGKAIYSQAINAQQAASHTINVSSWQGGMYFVRINNGKETVTTKFTKN